MKLGLCGNKITANTHVLFVNQNLPFLGGVITAENVVPYVVTIAQKEGYL